MTTYFVMNDATAKKYGFKYGSDANSGLSFDSAFKTISHAIAVTSVNAPQNIDKIYTIGGDNEQVSDSEQV